MAPPKKPVGPHAKELGGTGLKGAVPGQGWLYQELLPELRHPQAIKRFQQMADNDPICSALLYAVDSLVSGVKWNVQPTIPGNPDAEDAAEFLRTVLFEDMNIPFGDVINEALTMLPYGFSLLEIVAKKRNGEKADPVLTSKFVDGYVGLAKLAPRAQDSVHRWLFDANGGTVGIEQFLQDGRGMVTIPIIKLLHFKTTNRLGNPEGRSLLRGAYVSWVRKNAIEDAEGRVAARAGGVVELRVPGDILDPQAPPELIDVRNAYQAIADRMAQDRQGSIMLPSDTDESGKPLYEVRFAIPETRRPAELSQMVERYNRMIAMTVMADFLLLGHEQVGSLALADNKTTMFARAVSNLLGIIAEQFNRVLIPKLWAWNGFDPSIRPTLMPGDLENRDLAALAAFVTAMAGAGMPIFPDPVTEDFLRQQAGLPPRTEESGGGPSTDPNKDANAQQQVPPGTEPKQLPPGAKPPEEKGEEPPEEDEEELP